MPRCRYCGERFRDDDDSAGARCSNCREPLYQRRGAPRPLDPESDANGCAIHPHNQAIGTCKRCGNFLCTVCLARWRRRSFCIACVERLMDVQEATPQEIKSHFRQALLAMLFGVSAWGICLAAVVVAAMAAMGGGGPNVVVVGLAGLLIMASPMIGVLGVGQGAAAIRARGDHMIMATIGLLLSAFQVGVVIGLLTFAVWENG